MNIPEPHKQPKTKKAGCAIKVLLHPEVKDRVEILNVLGICLFNMGVVEEGYVERVIEREEKYPTGLQLSGSHNIALAHAGPELVNENAIVVGILKKPVDFFMMGEPEKSLPVKVVFMLAAVDFVSINGYVQNLLNGILLKHEIFEEIVSLADEDLISTKLKKIII